MGENLFRGPSRVLFMVAFGKPTILAARGAVAMELAAGLNFKHNAEAKLESMVDTEKHMCYVAEGELAFIRNIKNATESGPIEHYEIAWAPTVREATSSEWYRHTSQQTPWAIHLTTYDERQQTLIKE
jgi:hypothetical protein